MQAVSAESPAFLPHLGETAPRFFNPAAPRSPGESKSGVILAPVTLDRRTQAALPVARSLALKSNARLVLLHVVQLNIAGEERGIHRARLVNELCLEAGRELHQLADGMQEQVAVEVLVSSGRPAETIVQTAARLAADTVVMFSHGRRGWRRWLHHNTALAVARQAPCKVWLVGLGEPEPALSLTVVDRGADRRQESRLAA
jgi:nucleotide-binding universal stress UspA family protein